MTCTGGYPKPSWQSGFGTASTRQLPDVSLFAADGLHDSAWVLCASNLGTNNGTNCEPDQSGSYDFLVIGGTSASSPAFAAVLALVEQQLGGMRLGQADFTLYPLSKQAPGAFRDVTTGNISVVCSGSPASDPNACGSNGFLTGYNAGTGYDLATGLGSLDVTQLVQNWSKVTFTPTTTALTVNGATSPVTITHGSPVSVAVTVTSSGGTPSGDVAMVASGSAPAANAVQGTVASPSIFTLTNGAASDGAYTYLPGGSYNLVANYGGDGTFAPSTSTPGIPVTVSAEKSVLGLFFQDQSVSTNNLGQVTSVPYGTYVSVAAEPISSAQANQQNVTYFQQATGTVTFASTPVFGPLNPKTPVNVNSNGIAEIPNQLSTTYPPGTYNVTATYSGDASFTGSTATNSFTVTKNNVSISTASGSTSGSYVVTVDPAFGDLYFTSTFSLPTGAVKLTDSNGTSVGSGNLSTGTDAQGNQVAEATITATGTPTSASYAGDANYNAGSATVSGGGGGGGGAFSLSAAPSSLSISSGGSGNTTMNITPASGFTGTVNLSCSAGGSPLTCSLAKASVSVTGSAAVADTLTVNSTSSSELHMPADTGTRWYAAGGAALAGILLIGLPGRRRTWQRMLSLMLLFIAVGVVGCGGGGSKTNPPTSYTVTVTATSGTINQSSTVTVTVQ